MPSSRVVRLAALLVAAALVLGSCGGEATEPTDPGASVSRSGAQVGSPDTGIPLDALPLPDGDTDTGQVLLENADGSFDEYRSVGRLDGASLTCTLVLVDGAPGVTAGPAYALTNGHCLGINGNDTFTDQVPEGATAIFDYFADATERLEVPVVRAAYASMKGVDLAILELDAPEADLAAAGYRAWSIGPSAELDGATREVAFVGAPIGAPLVDIPEPERYLRLGTCSLDTETVLVNERLWLWAALRNDCPEVLPGNSGSPLFDLETARLVGLVNTTTFKGEAGAPCWLGRPCEVTEDGEAVLPDTSYAIPLDRLADCFGADGVFALGGGCGLDPGDGVTLTGAPIAVNPTAPDPISGDRRTTWATTVEGAGFTHYRAKVEPLETADCADEQGYGAPVPVTTPFDGPLPASEQRLLLCVVGGSSATPDASWQAFADASFAVVYVDTTPPTAAIEFSTAGNADEGWSVEPIFVPPELSLFLHKAGPRRSTDCDDPDGYAPYRRSPLRLPPGGPYRYCAIGFDDANNPSAPAGIVLK
jgi:hypothetical protein